MRCLDQQSGHTLFRMARRSFRALLSAQTDGFCSSPACGLFAGGVLKLCPKGLGLALKPPCGVPGVLPGDLHSGLHVHLRSEAEAA